ncbi:MAG TPA: sugar phosphate isomerase/epimerase family protein [Tepidisphaeraceae bacterium]|jgi:sugar phosphate isomerase/epimerase|nr:sugar phosphate isomerase/epimerase family protein [Tepidisphaeraceae bacterium]
MPFSRSRRSVLGNAGVALAAASIAGVAPAKKVLAAAAEVTTSSEPFGYCLNTSTIRGGNLTLVEELDIASKVGYHAIEPWISEIHDYQKKGGSLPDLAKRVSDKGITIEDAIGFNEWIVDDDARRAAGMEAMKHDMDVVATLGGKRIAAPPIGANKPTDAPLDLARAAERYRALLELGDKMGVQPLVELWGSSKNLHRLGEVAFVALEAGQPNASMLLDLYHLHKGGSGFRTLGLLNGAALHVIHTNDYPDMPLEQLTDAHRVYPGDGVAPLGDIFRTLRDIGFRGFLSLELFNRDYWKQSPLKVAQMGIDKMRESVRKSLS